VEPLQAVLTGAAMRERHAEHHAEHCCCRLLRALLGSNVRRVPLQRKVLRQRGPGCSPCHAWDMPPLTSEMRILLLAAK
jgi:hypothetical protein